jgi:dTDP-4-amino-4,6-dideoxygalactose transaminase
MNQIPYGRQSLDDDDIAAVVAVLKGDWLTQGPHVEEFELALADRVEARHAVAFSSGTAALHAAAAVAGWGPGDTVATSPLSFVASANCVRFVGANPRFVDIDPRTLNLDPSAVPADVAGLVAVHYAGLPVDLSRLSYRPRVVVEDAAHALGARTPDGPVGNCARSDLCCFSFHPVKAITTGEGGAVTTNRDDFAAGLRSFRNHGILRRPSEGGWYYEVERLGFNYRLTDIQAALGTSQLAKLPGFVDRRNALATRYRSGLADVLEARPDRLTLPPSAPPGFFHAYHLFPVQVLERRRIFDALRSDSIGVQVHYLPVHRHPLYHGFGSFPEADRVYEELMSLPLFPGLRDDEQDRVMARLRELVAP